MHNVKLIRKRFGKKGNAVVFLLVLLSASALGIGLGLLLWM
jgi:hypothetical protein